jgi:hypothetical protein
VTALQCRFAAAPRRDSRSNTEEGLHGARVGSRDSSHPTHAIGFHSTNETLLDLKRRHQRPTKGAGYTKAPATASEGGAGLKPSIWGG